MRRVPSLALDGFAWVVSGVVLYVWSKTFPRKGPLH